MQDILHKYVTADLKDQTEAYCLQGWVININPLKIICSDLTEYECVGTPTVVINPPDIPEQLYDILIYNDPECQMEKQEGPDWRMRPEVWQ